MRITAILLYVVTFLYIYNIKFVFIPGPLRSRMIIGIIAFFAFFMLGKTAWRVCGKVIMMSAVFCLLNVLSCLGSQMNDYWFVQFSVLTILYCFGGYWIGYLIKEKLHFSVYQFLSLFVIIVTVHNLIAFAGFVFPPIANFIGSVQDVGGGEAAMSSIVEFQVRALGFGVGNFFIGAVITSLAIIACFYLYLNKLYSFTKTIVLSGLLFLTGIFIARTVMLAAIGVLLFLFDIRSVKKFLIIAFLLFIVYLNIESIASFLESQFGINTSWAFEGFSAEGRENSSTLNSLKEMYIFPDNLRTWIIGDGLWDSEGGYYMNTDVGYFRLLFFVGLIGCLYYQFYTLYFIRLTTKRMYRGAVFGGFLGILFLLIQLKGFTDIMFFLYMLLPYMTVGKVGASRYSSSRVIGQDVGL